MTELNKSMHRRAEEALPDADVALIEDMTVLARRVKNGEPVLDPQASRWFSSSRPRVSRSSSWPRWMSST